MAGSQMSEQNAQNLRMFEVGQTDTRSLLGFEETVRYRIWLAVAATRSCTATLHMPRLRPVINSTLVRRT